MKLKEVRASALALPLRSRAKLAGDLLRSLEEQATGPAPERTEAEWEALIEARIDAYERGELKTISGEEFLRHVAKPYASRSPRRRSARV